MKFLKSPINIAIVSALGAGIFTFMYLNLMSPEQGDTLAYIGFSLLVIVLGFIVNYFLFKYYIEDRIKLVYRNILDDKLNEHTDEKLKEMNLGGDVITEVNKEVKEWADDKKKEIQVLKEMENYRKEFIGNVSHELKTPVFNIQGYIMTLLEGALEDEKINRHFLERALKSVDRMITLIEDLDLITRLESNQLVLNFEKFNLIELTKDISTALEMKASKSQVKIIIKDSDKNINVIADYSRIRQVIVNLIVNSIKYSAEENAITEVRFYHMDKSVLIEVADNGIGISKDHLPRLFERFYRTDKSRSRDKGGSGLGLAIVKHIVEAHGENINVRSTEGVGSTFSFTLKKA